MNKIIEKIKKYKIWLIVLVIVVVLIACQANSSQKNQSGIDEANQESQASFIEQIKAKEIFNNDFASVNKIKELEYTEKIKSNVFNYQSDVEFKDGVIQRKVNLFGNDYFLTIDKNNNKYFIFNDNLDPLEIPAESVKPFEEETLIDKINKIKESDYQQIGYQKVGTTEMKIFEFVSEGLKHKYWINASSKLPLKIEIYEPENTLTFEYSGIKLK